MLSIYRLPNSLPDEKLIQVVRKDFFILLKKVMLSLLLVVLYLGLMFFFFNANPNILNHQIYYPLVVLATSGYALFVTLFFFVSFIDYYLDVCVITSERIIDIRQDGLFARTISELKIDKIQDVTSSVVGVIPTILRYGKVEVQTAGEKSQFIFEDISGPESVRDTIIKLVEEKRCAHKEVAT